jgi:hypothetical protein
VKTRVFVSFPFHHIVLRLAEKSVLRAEKCRETKKITIVSLKNLRSMLELCRNRCWMKQRSNAQPAQFLWPKFAQMV